jgi:hypothetical protein
MNKSFPRYKTAEIAANWGCFSCFNKLDHQTIQETEYPPNRGQYAFKCANCQSWTFFDLEKTGVTA